MTLIFIFRTKLWIIFFNLCQESKNIQNILPNNERHRPSQSEERKGVAKN